MTLGNKPTCVIIKHSHTFIITMFTHITKVLFTLWKKNHKWVTAFILYESSEQVQNKVFNVSKSSQFIVSFLHWSRTCGFKQCAERPVHRHFLHRQYLCIRYFPARAGKKFELNAFFAVEQLKLNGFKNAMKTLGPKQNFKICLHYRESTAFSNHTPASYPSPHLFSSFLSPSF